MWRRGGGCKNLSYDSVKCNMWLGTEKRLPLGLPSATVTNPGARLANGALPHL